MNTDRLDTRIQRVDTRAFPGKQRSQRGRVSLGVRIDKDAPPKNMPTKKNDWPKGLQKKRGAWFQVFYDRDRSPAQKWVRLKATTLSRALIERGRVITAYESGSLDPWQPKTPDVTLQEAAAEYLESKSRLAPNSLRSKRTALALFFASVPSKTRPAQITAEDFRRFFERSRLKASSKTVRLVELSTFFKWCQLKGYAQANPAQQYKDEHEHGLSRFERKREERDGERRRAIMPEEFRALLGHITTAAATAGRPTCRRHSLMADLVLFAAATGLRRAELAHLCRRDVRLGPPVGRYPATGRLHVRNWENLQTGEHFRTKNGLDRRLALTPVAAQIAARHLAARETEDDYAPVFLSPRGRRLRVSCLTGWFGEYRKAAGLPEGTSFHSLRHSFASWLLMLGVDVFLVQRFMGHASLAQMENYAKLAERFVFGEAREVQREILQLLCPDLSPAALNALLPDRTSFFETFQARGLRRRRSVVPIEDVLFDGAAYEVEEALNHVEAPSRFGADLPGFIDPLLTA